MTNEKFKVSEHKKFYGNENLFFTYATWVVAVVALLALTFYIWSVFQNLDEL